MPTVDIAGVAGGGYVALNNSVLATVYDGTSTWAGAFDNSANNYVGLRMDAADYQSSQTFLGFDTSSTNIPAGATINSVTLTLTATDGWIVSNAPESVMEVHLFDWSADGLGTADYRTHTQLAALNSSPGLLASFVVVTDGSDSGDPTAMVFTSESAFVSSLNLDGTTYIVVADQRNRTDDADTTATRIGIASDDHGTAGYRPKLTVDYTEAVAGFTGLTVTRVLNG